MFLNDQILRQGLVGISLTGNVRVSTVVSQGCRPIGNTFVVTKAEANVIYELGGKDAYAVLKEVHSLAGSDDQACTQRARPEHPQAAAKGAPGKGHAASETWHAY